MVLKRMVIGGLLFLVTLSVAVCDDMGLPNEPSVTEETTNPNHTMSVIDRPEGNPSLTFTNELLASETTWILESLDGHSPIEESVVTFQVDDDWFGGCNHYGGRSNDGTSIADAGGIVSVPYPDHTLMDCHVPKGIMEQADAFISALVQAKTYSIVDGRLNIIDSGGATRLVFVKQ